MWLLRVTTKDAGKEGQPQRIGEAEHQKQRGVWGDASALTRPRALIVQACVKQVAPWEVGHRALLHFQRGKRAPLRSRQLAQPRGRSWRRLARTWSQPYQDAPSCSFKALFTEESFVVQLKHLSGGKRVIC